MDRSLLESKRGLRAVVAGVVVAAVALLQAPAFALDGLNVSVNEPSVSDKAATSTKPGEPAPVRPMSVAPAAGTVTLVDTDEYLNAAEAAAGSIPANWEAAAGSTATSATVWFEDALGNIDTANGCGPWNVSPTGFGAVNASCAAALPQGAFTFKGEWTDGTETSEIASDSMIKDTIAPAASISLADGDGVVNAAEAGAGVDASWDVAETGPAVDVTLANTGNPAPLDCQLNDVARTSAATAIPAACFAALTDGSITLTVSGADEAGNPATATHTATLDRVGPAAPGAAITPNPINIATQHDVVVSGAASGTAVHIELTDGTTTLTADPAVTDGAYTHTFDAGSSLEDGTLTATVTFVDADGNVSAPGTATAVMDTVAPQMGEVEIKDEDGYLNAAELDANVVVKWTAATGSDAVSAVGRFTTSDGNTIAGGNCGPFSLAATDPVDGAGYINASCAHAAPEGELQWRAAWKDAAGNTSVEAATAILKDSVAPAAPAFTSPADGSTIGVHNSLMISGTGENGAELTLKEGALTLGDATVSPTGSWSIEIVAPTDGSHTLSANQVDLANNPGPSGSVTFTVDKTMPLITEPADGAPAQPATTTIAGTGEPATTVEIWEVLSATSAKIVGSARVNAAGVWTTGVGFPTGSHTIKARGIDVLGVASGYTATRSFTVDADAPTVTIAAPAPAAENITGTATDLQGVVRIRLRYFNALTGVLIKTADATCATCGPTATSVTWTAPAEGTGLLRVEATAYDSAGQASATKGASYIAL